LTENITRVTFITQVTFVRGIIMSVLSKMSEWFMATTTWIKALVWFISSQLVYFTMLFVTIPAVENQGKGMKIFDLMPMGYSHQYATRLLENLFKQSNSIRYDLSWINGSDRGAIYSLIFKKN
jgi:hypothetical protein